MQELFEVTPTGIARADNAQSGTIMSPIPSGSLSLDVLQIVGKLGKGTSAEVSQSTAVIRWRHHSTSIGRPIDR
jgi:hypothetical protein